MLAEERERIALYADRAVAIPQLEFIVRSLSHPRDEDLPHSAAQEFPHWMPSSIPLIEISDDRDTLGIRCPNVESRAAYTVDLNQVSTELLVQLPVLPLTKEMEVEGSENRRK